MINRDIFFSTVKAGPPFNGKLTQEQVDGMNAILDVWESEFEGIVAAQNGGVVDLRWLANPLAQTYHEVSGTMQPIEEYQGAQQSYGGVDPETGQRYYGRGYIQCTHRENYARCDKELGLTGGARTEWDADLMLEPAIAAGALFEGMIEGWYRKSGSPATPNNLAKYFNDNTNDVYGAREIINGDKSKVPSWSNGVSIGNLIKGYHEAFLRAVEAAWFDDSEIEPEPPAAVKLVTVLVSVPPGVKVDVQVIELDDD